MFVGSLCGEFDPQKTDPGLRDRSVGLASPEPETSFSPAGEKVPKGGALALAVSS